MALPAFICQSNIVSLLKAGSGRCGLALTCKGVNGSQVLPIAAVVSTQPVLQAKLLSYKGEPFSHLQCWSLPYRHDAHKLI